MIYAEGRGSECMSLSQWLRTNKSILEKYTSPEVALLALEVGFQPSEAIPGVIDHICALKRKLDLWESPLRGHWIDLAFYQSLGHTWDD